MSESAISRYGYYVHYYAANEIKSNGSPKDQALSQYAIKRVQDRAATLQSGISTAVKQEYAKMIAGLTGKNQEAVPRDKWNQFKKEIDNILANKFTSAAKSGAKMIPGGKVVGKTNKTAVKTFKQTQYFNQQQFDNLQKAMLNVQNEINQFFQPKHWTLDEFKTMKKYLQDIYNLVNNYINQASNAGLKIWRKTEEKRFDLGREGSLALQILNELLANAGLSYIGLSVAQGFAGELVTAAAADLIKGVSIDAVNQGLKRLSKDKTIMRGSESPNLKYTFKGISNTEVKPEFLKKITKKEVTSPQGVKTVITTNASQQKIDVTVSLPVELNSTKLKPVNISNKAIDLRYDIGLVSGTNLWYLIQNENIKKFLRPYLNVMASHTQSAEKGGLQERNAARELIAARSDALLATKLLTAYKALSGDTFGRSAAQLFIVNDVGKDGRVYVLEINDIIKAVLEDVKNNPSAIDNYFSYNYTINDLHLTNQWVEGDPDTAIDERMSNLINDAHAKKISISLRNTVNLADFVGSTGARY